MTATRTLGPHLAYELRLSPGHLSADVDKRRHFFLCDTPAVLSLRFPAVGFASKKWNGRILSDFVKGYHHQILTKVGPDGRWSNIVYPHHFWSSPSIEQAFATVDMRQVSAYVMVIDSVCLDPETGAMKRKVYRNEYRIDVAGNG